MYSHPGQLSYGMPYKRKYAGADQPSKRRRLWLRKSRVASIGAMAALRRGRADRRFHAFKRVCQASTIQGNGGGAIEFRLNELPDFSDFTNLFDKYRIKGVQITIVPRVNSYDANPNATLVGMPMVHTAIDYNDSTAPANVQELMQYDTYKRTQGFSPHTRYFKPRVSNEVFRTLVQTSYAMGSGNQWLDCTTSGADLPHFCLKWRIDNCSQDPTSFLVYKTFYLEFLGTK